MFLVIKDLPRGSETSVASLLGNDRLENLSTQELFDNIKQLIIKCENENIKLNFDKYSDAEIGIPFYIPFTKK